MTSRRFGAGSQRARVSTLLLAAAAAGSLLTGCGSSSSPHVSASVEGTTKQQDCTAVADVLSDGPDPGADPVGYAEAQVRPLRQLKLSEPALKKYVADLADAYAAFSKSNGGKGTTQAHAVTTFQSKVNSICPGAAS